jgi:ribosomal protein S18 acetylase RimI-like enzyme
VEVTTISIRPAYKTDAEHITALILQASQDVAQALTGTDDEQEVLAVLVQLFQSEGNRLSYHNALVAEEEQHIVGIIVVYHGRDAARLDRPIIERLKRLLNDPSVSLDKETDEDEFYIDTLAVSPQYAGRGIGTALIHAAEQRAQQLQYNKMALNVDNENERARRLYDYLGYREDKIVHLYNHPHHHLVKYL